MGRRETKTRVAAVLAGLAVLPGLAACAEDPDSLDSTTFVGQCPGSALPMPAELAGPVGELDVVDMDPLGRFVLANVYPQDREEGQPPTQVLRWDNGVAGVVAITGARATAVNRHGVIVGIGSQTVGEVTGPTAMIFTDAWGMGVLPTPEGHQGAEAFAINDRGDVAGLAYVEGAAKAVVIWSAGPAGYTPRLYEVQEEVRVTDIAEDGTVVGELGGEPYAWAPDGTASDLPLPDGHRTGTALQARGVWAVGLSYGDVNVVVRWNMINEKMLTVGPHPQDAEFVAVSTIGDVAYFDGVGTTVIRYGDAYELPRLPELPQGQPGGPVAISDNSMIVAGEYPGAGVAVVWHCAPQPSPTPSV